MAPARALAPWGRFYRGGLLASPSCSRPTSRILDEMGSVEDLQASVAADYELLAMPSWPDPHPGMAAPRDDEYSRVTQPERYRIVQGRARAWTRALQAVPGVEAENLTPAPLDADGHLGDFDRGVRLTPRRPGTLALLLLERDAPLTQGDARLPVLHISVVRPEISVMMLPDCGCDACDSGSQDLLRAIDETIVSVVGGTSVVLRGKAWQAHWWPEGARSGGGRRAPGHDQVMEWCRRLASGQDVRLPRGTEALVGHTWLEGP